MSPDHPNHGWSIRITSVTRTARALALAPVIVRLISCRGGSWALIIILIIFVFILPNPAAVGTYIGNAIDSIVIFFRSIGTSVNTV